MRKLIVLLLLILISCNEKVSFAEKTIPQDLLKEPTDIFYVELLSYYPAKNKKGSNFYIVKDIHSSDTLYVVDKDSLQVEDYIKHYNGVENTAIVLEKRNSASKKEYIVNIPSHYHINTKKLYLGELTRLID